MWSTWLKQSKYFLIKYSISRPLFLCYTLSCPIVLLFIDCIIFSDSEPQTMSPWLCLICGKVEHRISPEFADFSLGFTFPCCVWVPLQMGEGRDEPSLWVQVCFLGQIKTESWCLAQTPSGRQEVKRATCKTFGTLSALGAEMLGVK